MRHKPYNSLPYISGVVKARENNQLCLHMRQTIIYYAGYCKHIHEVIRWNFHVTRTLTNIDFSIVIIIGGYLVHIQYNVVSSDTKLYLFLRVVNKMENSEDNFMMKMTHDLQMRKCIQQRRYKWKPILFWDKTFPLINSLSYLMHILYTLL